MIKVKIDEVFQKSGLSKYAVTKQTGLSFTNFTNLLGGENTSIRYESLDKLCKLFKCNVQDLIEFVPDEDINERKEEPQS